MHKAQDQVAAFHSAIDHTVGETPAIRDAELRAKLILEEAVETIEGLLGARAARHLLLNNFLSDPNKELSGDLVDLWRAGVDGVFDITPKFDTPPNLEAVADGICDTLVVLYGTAVACGLDIEPLFDEVMRANMEKTTGPTRADGKRLKPPGWQPPRIAELLAEQIIKAAVK